MPAIHPIILELVFFAFLAAAVWAYFELKIRRSPEGILWKEFNPRSHKPAKKLGSAVELSPAVTSEMLSRARTLGLGVLSLRVNDEIKAEYVEDLESLGWPEFFESTHDRANELLTSVPDPSARIQVGLCGEKDWNSFRQALLRGREG